MQDDRVSLGAGRRNAINSTVGRNNVMLALADGQVGLARALDVRHVHFLFLVRVDTTACRRGLAVLHSPLWL